MDFIDFFCGCGTIRMGMEQAGHRCVYSVEWDNNKRRIYDVIFGKEPEGQDIRRVRGFELPRARCWCFGAPCQDFSIIGQRKGLGGDKSSLVREIFRLVREIKEEYRPDYLLYENVKGMLSSNKGFDFLEILSEMASLGYDRIEYSLLNSKFFGVPHNRERMFTIGHLRNRSTRKIFPITGNCRTVKSSIVACADYRYDEGLRIRKQGESPCLKANMHKMVNNGDLSNAIYVVNNTNEIITYEVPQIVKVKKHRIDTEKLKDLLRNSKSLSNKEIASRLNKPITLVAHWFRNDSCFAVPDADIWYQLKELLNIKTNEFDKSITEFEEREGTYEKANRVYDEHGIAPTLTRTSADEKIFTQGRIRKLTPREAWRLQGIPENIIDKVIKAGIGDAQMYKAAGDACTVNVIHEIARRL